MMHEPTKAHIAWNLADGTKNRNCRGTKCDKISASTQNPKKKRFTTSQKLKLDNMPPSFKFQFGACS